MVQQVVSRIELLAMKYAFSPNNARAKKVDNGYEIIYWRDGREDRYILVSLVALTKKTGKTIDSRERR